MRRVRLIVAIAAALLAITAVPALADDRGEPVIDDVPGGEWWYFDDVDGYVMTSGVPVGVEWCFGEQAVDHTMTSWQQPDGLWTSKLIDSGFPIFLYDGGFADIIPVGCEAAATGGEIPQPVATGIGESTATFTDQTEPWLGGGPPPTGAYIENSVRGVVTHADGTSAKINGTVAYLATATGPAIDLIDITVIPLG